MLISRNPKLNSHFATLCLSLTIVIVLQLCHPSSGAASGPRIEIYPSSSVIYYDIHASNKVIVCKALGDRPGMFNQLRWTGPNRVDNWDELSKRHTVRERTRNGHSIELKFERPSPDDSGTYYCFGTYQSSDVYNASIAIKMYNPIRMENCHNRQFVVEGVSNQKVTCQITGDSLTVAVFKDGKPFDQYQNRYIWNNAYGLEITNVTNKLDAGEYTVEATNEATGDRITETIRVEVHSKPEVIPANLTSETFTKFGTELISVEGEKAELKCDVMGNPQPLVYWLDPRLRNVTSVGGYFVNQEKGTLLISRANRVDDNGNFQCIAYNNVGESRRNVSMLVLQRPSIVAFENKTVEEGQEVTLECRATGFPRPTFSIRKHGLNQVPYRVGDGTLLDINDSEEGGGAEVHVHRIRIRATRSHFGLHYCNATNDAGSYERIGQLSVKYKPDLSLTANTQYTKQGKNVSLHCHIKAYPDPHVTWYFENQQMANFTHVKTHRSSDEQTHIISIEPGPTFQSYNSRYKCVAQNSMGYGEQIIDSRLNTAPGIVTAHVLEATPTTVKLQLSVSSDGGNPVRAYKYKAEGVTLDHNNPIYSYPRDKQNENLIEASPSLSVYTIRNLFPYYSYRISIRAINDVGEGDYSEVHVETRRPTRPEPPFIVKPTVTSSNTQNGVASEYQDGYLIKWGPPDSDNGDPVTKYIIKFNRVDPLSTDIVLEEGEERVIEQMNDKPMYTRISNLKPNNHYKIQLQARNLYGDSDAAYIIIYTSGEKPTMPTYDPQTLPWLMEPSTTVYMILLIVAITALIVLDTTFCLCCGVGVGALIKSRCCPSKANSVISDKTYNGA